MKSPVIALFALMALVSGAAGCKQGIGERCQQSGDCASGVCSQSEPRVCQGNGSGVDTTQIDADLPFDATQIDARQMDAATDAATDAGPDATP
jgi:hypothetical protein